MPRTPIGTLPLNILLPKGLKEELLALAAGDRRNLSGFVRIALIAHVARVKSKLALAPDAPEPAGGQHG